MSEFLHGLAILSAVFIGAAAVSFGLYAGIQAATMAFGPIRINFSHGPVRVDFGNSPNGDK